MTQPTIPAGWKLVPVELTEAMGRACFDAWAEVSADGEEPRKAWSAMLAASPRPPEQPTIAGERETWDNVFWLIVREPGRVPDRCGPYRNGTLAATMRETMRVRPTALIDVLTIGYLGPEVQHGPEALQMLDGRSMSVGRKHNARTREAFEEYLARPSVRDGEAEQTLEHLRQSASRLAPECDRLADAVPIVGEPDPLWWERQSALREAATVLRFYAARAALTPSTSGQGGEG